MRKAFSAAVPAIAAAALVQGCATSPKSIKAAYVSPGKYEQYSCRAIAVERTAVQYRANILYHSLKRRAGGDVAVAAAGAVLFPPALLFIKGNGPKAAEFAQLQGDYQALHLTAAQRGCGIDFPDIRRVAAAKDPPPVPVEPGPVGAAIP